MPSRDIAKSLHTLTVICQVAQAVGGLEAALAVLGLAGRPDPYKLAERAAATLAQRVQA